MPGISAAAGSCEARTGPHEAPPMGPNELGMTCRRIAGNQWASVESDCFDDHAWSKLPHIYSKRSWRWPQARIWFGTWTWAQKLWRLHGSVWLDEDNSLWPTRVRVEYVLKKRQLRFQKSRATNLQICFFIDLSLSDHRSPLDQLWVAPCSVAPVGYRNGLDGNLSFVDR